LGTLRALTRDRKGFIQVVNFLKTSFLADRLKHLKDALFAVVIGAMKAEASM
jgi:hypothetical protein